MKKIDILKAEIKKREAEEKRILKIRTDRNAFREYVIKDDRTGKKIAQEDIHRSWVAHIEHCQKKGKHCAILSPWGHGKSVQIAIAESLFIIGNNPAIRIKIINSSDEYAMDRVKAIKSYIEMDDDFKAVFPNVQRDDSQQWTDHRLYVTRPGHAIDPTIEARGIITKGVGGRADVLIFDDPVDEESIHSEKKRDAVRTKYQNLWMSRLVDTGFVLYIATRWHEEDLTKTIIESGRYSVLIQRVSEDFNSIEQERIE